MPERGRDRARRPRRVGELVTRFRREAAPPTLLASVQSSWEEAVGRQVAGQATPVAEHDGVVTVRCRSAVWAAELTMLSNQLAENLNKALSEGPRVRGLRFAAGGERGGRKGAVQGP
jgi:predicted nucleic acid-binding Zn ribbon protein